MTYFLSEPRRTELYNALVESGMEVEAAKVLTEVEDDLGEVDLCMDAHAKSIIYFNNQHNPEEAAKGVACLIAFIREARERGLAETNFPTMLATVKHDIENRKPKPSLH